MIQVTIVQLGIILVLIEKCCTQTLYSNIVLKRCTQTLYSNVVLKRCTVILCSTLDRILDDILRESEQATPLRLPTVQEYW